jgi:hypothetical protein
MADITYITGRWRTHHNVDILKYKSSATSTRKGYNYTVKSMDVLVAEFVSWKIIMNAKI